MLSLKWLQWKRLLLAVILRFFWCHCQIYQLVWWTEDTASNGLNVITQS